MAAELTVKINASAQEVRQVLRDGMSHVELVSEDVFRAAGGETYIAALLYEHCFMRVGNQVALMLLVSGDSHMTRVKSVACASSRDLLLNFDYQTLHALEDAGMIRRISMEESVYRYDANVTPHAHLVCRKCGRVDDADESLDPMLKDLLEEQNKAAASGESSDGWRIYAVDCCF